MSDSESTVPPATTDAVKIDKVVSDLPPADPPPPADSDAGGGDGAGGGGSGPAKQRDAIIVIPGLAGTPGVSLEDVARRMAMAMDNLSDATATFEATKGQEEAYGKRSARTVTIVRKDGAVETPVADLYEFNYRETLTSSMADKKPIQQLAYMALATAFATPRMVGALKRSFFNRKSKPLAHQFQVAYGLGMFLVMFAYIVLLVLVLGGSIAESVMKQRQRDRVEQTAQATGPQKGAPATQPQTPPAARQQVDGGGGSTARAQKGAAQTGTGEAAVRAPRDPWWKRWLDWGKTGIVSFTLLGFFIRFNLKSALEKSAPTLACTSDYLGMGARRKAMVGELSRLIDHLDAKKKDGFTYRNVHVMGYSFGSVVAMDALFPQEAAPDRRQERIHTLVTIGCPFDFVRTYWSDYFGQRYGSATSPQRWINVYTEADVLGSNFMDESAEGETAAGVMVDGSDKPRRPEGDDNVAFGTRKHLHQYPVFEQMLFAGFRVHGQYWDRDTDEGVTCFGPIVKRLYAGDPVLA